MSATEQSTMPDNMFAKVDLPDVAGADKSKVEEVGKKMHKDMSANMKMMEDALLEEGGRVATCKTVDEACAILQKEMDADRGLFSGPALWGMEAMGKTERDFTQAFALHADVRNANGDIAGFDCNRAAARMRKYAQAMHDNKFIFDGVTVARIEEVHARLVQEGWFRLLDPLDKQGRLTFLMTMSKLNFDKITAERHKMVVEYFFLLFHGIMYDEDAQKKGVCYVNDYTGLQFSMIFKAAGGNTDEKAKKALHTLMLGALPIKMKNMFLVNMPWWLDIPMKVVLVFLSQKLKDRIRFVSKRWRKVYHEVQDQSFWPSENGGGGAPLSEFPTEKMTSFVAAYRQSAASVTVAGLQLDD